MYITFQVDLLRTLHMQAVVLSDMPVLKFRGKSKWTYQIAYLVIAFSLLVIQHVRSSFHCRHPICVCVCGLHLVITDCGWALSRVRNCLNDSIPQF